MNTAFFTPVKAEGRLIVQQAVDIWAYISEEALKKEVFSSLEDFYTFFHSAVALDMVCMDITAPGAVPIAEALRQEHDHSALMLIADISIMPNVYLKPTIMASSLLLRPLGKKQAEAVIRELFLNILQSRKKEDANIFLLKTQDGVLRIAYRDILYFEARDKKLYVRTLYEEYSFYSTIEKLIEDLPVSFQRCHRSFLINTEKVRKIAFPESVIYLEDEVVVPLSRSYRSAAREWIK